MFEHNQILKEHLVYVAGHTGLAGSAVVRALKNRGFNNIIKKTHAELELTDISAVRDFFEKYKPRHVILCAAKVGGIWANYKSPADFIHQNLSIQYNVITSCHDFMVNRLIFLGSSCIYPKNCPQPMQEAHLLSGPLEETNQAYAIAKICGIEMCRAYNTQYNTSYLAVMPTNLYGPNDNYDLENSHVLAALMRKFHEANKMGKDSVTAWGSGRPKREFLYSDDLGDAVSFLLELDHTAFRKLCDYSFGPLINIGYGSELTINDLAEKIASIVGFKGSITWDKSKPDGAFQKLLDVSRMSALGWQPKVSLEHGIRLAYQAMLQNIN